MSKVRIKRKMTGRELARLLYRSRLRWNNGSMHDHEGAGQRGSYCLLGQIARYAGYNDEVIDNAEERGNIPEINDGCKTRAELRRKLCTDHGEEMFDLSSFLDNLEATKEMLRK